MSSLPPSLPLQKDEVYLNLVLDFVPETVYRVARHFNKAKSIIPIIYVKVMFHFHSTVSSIGEKRVCFFPPLHVMMMMVISNTNCCCCYY